MKRDRKSEILAAAERLLDAGGPHAVSMRGVAAALGISVGNLTYHFPQKKDLLEAVMRARHERCRALPPPSTVPGLDGFFRSLLARRGQIPPACETPDQARDLMLLAAEHIAELLHGAMEAFAAEGLLRQSPELPAVEQALLALLMLGRAEEVFGALPDAEKTRRCAWGVLSLLLTEKGRAELDHVL